MRPIVNARLALTFSNFVKPVLNKEISMECQTEQNLKKCNCSYEPCPRKGNCCECLTYHLGSRELPACCFPDDSERTYDRSFDHFARLVAQNRV